MLFSMKTELSLQLGGGGGGEYSYTQVLPHQFD